MAVSEARAGKPLELQTGSLLRPGAFGESISGKMKPAGQKA